MDDGRVTVNRSHTSSRCTTAALDEALERVSGLQCRSEHPCEHGGKTERQFKTE